MAKLNYPDMIGEDYEEEEETQTMAQHYCTRLLIVLNFSTTQKTKQQK
jgi:hypothetical protein